MIITLLYQNTANTILFSSVTSFSENYNASVTSHPVESGKSVSDNITNDNAKFQLSGVISDFDYYNPIKELAYGVNAEYNDSINNKFKLSRFENGQFVSAFNDIPSEFTAAYIKESLKTARDRGTLFSLFIYDDSNKLERHYPNCALTSLSFKADGETEFCIYPEMSFEQLNIVDVLVEQIATNKIPLLSDKNKAAGQGDKGKVDDCLDPMKVDGDVISKDITKQKVAKGQRPRPKCEPDPKKTAGETSSEMRERQYKELDDARIQVIVAEAAYNSAERLKKSPVELARLRNKVTDAIYNVQVVLPRTQSEQLAKKLAEEAGSGQ